MRIRAALRRLGSLLMMVGIGMLAWVGDRVVEREAGQALALLHHTPESTREEVSKPPRRPRPGDVVARIVVPDAGVDAVAFEGIDLPTLDRGAGHFPGTALPGQRGNSSFTAHRNTDFRGLRHIAIGHSIYVERGGSAFHYRVAETRVVEPEQVDVIRYRGRDELTLITCHPFDWVGPAPRRFVVHADLVERLPAAAIPSPAR